MQFVIKSHSIIIVIRRLLVTAHIIDYCTFFKLQRRTEINEKKTLNKRTQIINAQKQSINNEEMEKNKYGLKHLELELQFGLRLNRLSYDFATGYFLFSSFFATFVL